MEKFVEIFPYYNSVQFIFHSHKTNNSVIISFDR